MGQTMNNDSNNPFKTHVWRDGSIEWKSPLKRAQERVEASLDAYLKLRVELRPWAPHASEEGKELAAAWQHLQSVRKSMEVH